MPVSIVQDDTHDVVIIKCTQPWSLHEFFQAQAGPPPKRIMYDMLDAGSLSWMDTAAIRNMNNFFSQFDQDREGACIAIVVPSIGTQAIARLYTEIANMSREMDNVQRQVFADCESAMEWLTLRDT